jgi:hypothetical protein
MTLPLSFEATPTTAVCPVCNGTLRQSAGDGPYRQWAAGYRASDNTIACQNCGGQRMFGTPTGFVPLNKTGVPCTHNYSVIQNERYSHVHSCVCLECGDTFELDSGD